jgi:uncharacterized LabA/DUF88 family protein
LSQLLINSTKEEIKNIFYLETPYNENFHSKDVFRKQQSFFGKIYQYTSNGQVKHIKGVYRVEKVRVPTGIVNTLRADIQTIVRSISWSHQIEKGGDVGLAVRLVRDTFLDNYDHAILIAADQDYAPALNIILSDARKRISIAYVDNTYRNAMALKNLCNGRAEFIRITRRMIDACEIKWP